MPPKLYEIMTIQATDVTQQPPQQQQSLKSSPNTHNMRGANRNFSCSILLKFTLKLIRRIITDLGMQKSFLSGAHFCKPNSFNT